VLAVPTAIWTMSDSWSLVVGGYLPFGSSPVGPSLTSQFGASPRGLFVQGRAYR
jgi:hypothetical protein